jgi:dolichyl-phosphate beta-glucosyltransferase
MRHETNMGKGAAVRTGVLQARGDIILFSDADLATPIADMVPLLNALSENSCDVAIGSRAVPGATVIKQQARPRVLIGKAGNVFIRTWLQLPHKDTQCGFKAFKREAALSLFQEQRFPRWSFDIEALYKAKLRGMRVEEIPVSWKDSGRSHVRPLTDALAVLLDVISMRLFIK